MKKSLVILMAVAMLLIAAAPVLAAPLSDAPSSDHWVYEYYEMVYNAGLIQGYPDGTFKGEKAATRYEVVVFMARLMQFFESKLAGVQPGEPKTEGPVGLSEDEVKALIEEAIAGANYVDPAKLKEETDLLWTAITELEKEFKDELQAMGVRVTTLEKRVDALEKTTAQMAQDLAATSAEVKNLQAADADLKKSNSTSLVVGIGAAILGVVAIILNLAI